MARMRIKDAQLKTALQATPVTTVDDAGLVPLLAALGDGFSDEATLRQQLSAPGITRQQQLDLVKAGLDADEQEDIAELLDNGKHVFTPAGRNLLEALLSRAPLDSQGPALTVDGGGTIQGSVGADERVEVLNLSTATALGARLTDTMEVARADAWGKFTGSVKDASVGDTLRVQTRNAQGRVTSWLNVRVQQAGSFDPRAAFVDAGRVALQARGDGTVQLSQATRLPVSEPGANVRFTHVPSGSFVDVTLDANGRLPPLVLNGNPGDSIQVAVSDGAGNTDFSSVAATLVVPDVLQGQALEDPAPLTKDRFLTAKPIQGPLFVGDPSAVDVAQGQIGNCYVPAACAAVAHADPDSIRDLIRPNEDGSFTVTLHPAGRGALQVRVDADVYGNPGSPRYGKGLASNGGEAPTWFPLVEKAWATHLGSYEKVGQGGSVGQMMADITGRPNKEHWLKDADPDATWQSLLAGQAEGRAMASGTYGTAEAARYSGTGVYANHAYSVLGGVEENGQRLVILRNPWGTGEAGSDGKNDGIFKLPLDKFIRLYQVLNIC